MAHPVGPAMERLLAASSVLPDVVRFGVVTVLSLGLDLAVAWSLTTAVGLHLVLSVAAGFLTGATFNYIVHELWTFPGLSRRLSVRRWCSYVGAVSLVLGVRLLLIGALEALAPGRTDGTLLLLLGVSGVSFTVNYVLSKYVIFRSPPG